MFARQIGVRAVHALALVGMAASIGGCAAKVKREDFNNEMVRLREEIATSDRQLGSRLDSTNQQVASTNQQVTDQTRRLDALEQEFKAFRDEYKVSMEKMQGMIKFNVPVHFEYDRADLREGDRPVLDRFAAVVKQYYPGALVTVEGFADPSGNAGYNKRLGQRRADAVKEYLGTTSGLDNGHIKTVSYGEARDRQVVTGAAGPGDKGIENRRVALVIDHEAIATDKITTQ